MGGGRDGWRDRKGQENSRRLRSCEETRIIGLQTMGWMRTPEPGWPRSVGTGKRDPGSQQHIVLSFKWSRWYRIVICQGHNGSAHARFEQGLGTGQIGRVQPRCHRSGYFRSPGPVQEEEQQVLSSSSEGSEDEEDPEHEQFEKAQDHVMQPFAGNFDDSKLDGMTFFRHPVSRVTHITADESANLFKCGRDINRVYINLGGQAYEPLI